MAVLRLRLRPSIVAILVNALVAASLTAIEVSVVVVALVSAAVNLYLMLMVGIWVTGDGP